MTESTEFKTHDITGLSTKLVEELENLQKHILNVREEALRECQAIAINHQHQYVEGTSGQLVGASIATYIGRLMRAGEYDT
jgi:hypothetical protein